ncbi:Galactose-3-O-sulfotransferase, variant 2 [Dermatophagoides farinae]|uniref:Galactose-3-O-sulfotransferase, variant 2 n=1 Tax=Dermatophagoides farinae TaxID=6954 RepID=A0A922L8F1_DERFA|nr:Galactose-3-O-sulfotransferase, variant 2 [Dermatophagoides farinae]
MVKKLHRLKRTLTPAGMHIPLANSNGRRPQRPIIKPGGYSRNVSNIQHSRNFNRFIFIIVIFSLLSSNSLRNCRISLYKRS